MLILCRIVITAPLIFVVRPRGSCLLTRNPQLNREIRRKIRSFSLAKNIRSPHYGLSSTTSRMVTLNT